jgi:tetratricopeptide (TPR) repeat protein
MLKRRMIASWITISLWLLASTAFGLQAVPEIRAGLLRANDLLLNREADKAEDACRHLLTLPQGEAPGRLCLSLVTLARAEEMDDPAPQLDRFLAQVTEAIATAEALERSRPADAELHFLLGVAHGSKALVDGGRKNYLAAWRDIREAHRRFEQTLQLDPTLVDAYYGLGLYNYALGRLPALVKPLVSVALPRGDAAHGLLELERVAEQGTYFKMTARVALLHLYAGQEEKYAEAFRLGRDLVLRYPGNPDLYFATAHAASELGQAADALEIARRIARNLAEAHPRFTPDLLPRYNQLMGKIYMDQGEHASALAFFQRAIQGPTPTRYRWVTAWAWTRSGMIHDLQGNREEAIRRYRQALAVETEGLAKELARRYLDEPYRGRTRPAS